MEDIICIHKTYNSQDADLIKSRLEIAGIPCYLRSDNAGGTLPYLTLANGIGIMVRAEDEEAANEILNTAEVIYEKEVEEYDDILESSDEIVEEKSDKVSIFCVLLIFFILPILYLLKMLIS